MLSDVSLPRLGERRSRRELRLNIASCVSLKDVNTLNSFYEAQVIDVAVLHENSQLKHFVSGDTTGPAKVSRVHCRSRSGLPVLVS